MRLGGPFVYRVAALRAYFAAGTTAELADGAGAVLEGAGWAEGSTAISPIIIVWSGTTGAGAAPVAAVHAANVATERARAPT